LGIAFFYPIVFIEYFYFAYFLGIVWLVEAWRHICLFEVKLSTKLSTALVDKILTPIRSDMTESP